MSLERLKNDFENLLPKIEQAASDLAVEFALKYVETVTAEARVDTSKLISNFQVFTGSANQIQLEAFVSGRDGSTRNQSRSRVIKNAEKTLIGKSPNDNIMIVNNVPYLIPELDIGNSFELTVSAVKGSKLKIR